MTPRTIDECYRKLGLTSDPRSVQCVTMSRLRELVRRAWNFATAAERKRMMEIDERKETA